MGKVFEESEELDDVVLLDDLDAYCVGRPLLVDGYHHSTTGDGEGSRHAIKLDFEASDSKLEAMEILERVERQSPYRGRTCKRS